ncbi:MAG: SIMPL domain-containing protein [Dehalococcoidia bacterium]
MKPFLLALPAALLLMTAVACGDKEGDVNNITVPPAGPSTGINVSGEGRVTVEPDVAILNLGVEFQDENADAALVNANGAFDNLMEVLTDAGVAEEDIQTTGVSVQPIYDYSTETPRITGYLASNIVNVKIRDLESVGEIIDAATGAAGNAVRINYISFDREDRADALAQARAQAVADAREKAEALAEGAGVELGDLQTISETSLVPQPPIPFDERALGGEGTGDVAQTSISPGTLELIVNVIAVYGINQ